MPSSVKFFSSLGQRVASLWIRCTERGASERASERERESIRVGLPTGRCCSVSLSSGVAHKKQPRASLSNQAADAEAVRETISAETVQPCRSSAKRRRRWSPTMFSSQMRPRKSKTCPFRWKSFFLDLFPSAPLSAGKRRLVSHLGGPPPPIPWDTPPFEIKWVVGYLRSCGIMTGMSEYDLGLSVDCFKLSRVCIDWDSINKPGMLPWINDTLQLL